MIKHYIKYIYDYIIYIIILTVSIFITATSFYYLQMFNSFNDELSNLYMYTITQEPGEEFDLDNIDYYYEQPQLNNFDSKNDDFKVLYNCIVDSSNVNDISIDTNPLMMFDTNSSAESGQSISAPSFNYKYYSVASIGKENRLEETFSTIEPIEGVYFENDSEVMVSSTFVERSGYKIGDEITLKVFDSQNMADVDELEEKKYKIVGIYDGLSYGHILVSNKELLEITEYSSSSVNFTSSDINALEEECGNYIELNEMMIISIGDEGLDKYSFIKSQSVIFRNIFIVSLIISAFAFITMSQVLCENYCGINKIKKSSGYTKIDIWSSFVLEHIIMFLISLNIFIFLSSYVKRFVLSVYFSLVNSAFLQEDYGLVVGNSGSIFRNYYKIIFENLTDHVTNKNYDATSYYILILLLIILVACAVFAKVREKDE